ncbi:hypothetical protein [Shimazuella kribbensis]|nr:hypothetical protein [Shimazuella kribbensis]
MDKNWFVGLVKQEEKPMLPSKPAGVYVRISFNGKAVRRIFY